ncbi:MAG: HhoA/HhoB/HtrA family serine endopeptidase [Microcystis sp.]|uniref:HhoA/HhoB/HtrA family serine endopeptidase n=1 Tax=unclassified Microcystis TaxID=2643300 RepID=UPI002585754B|nr:MULTISPECIES: HhoA/HhoB/HtrA family serine endopeptidase [unclassified Microcystis]MCA2686098.1 trypsin-like peptidase domain-containing protein [Microcystis sp. M046S2]MCA2705025.1 trypsin-like peptidase domain-containing protein [Microcystis sp. M038S2]MCA2948713.1 trypsin-like peptidase domain-containing protein [Microcystis sp. M109S1]MCA2953431.1 trypsin-like peptidase domain-containing protein [Microcystis sp. M112S1]
MKLPTGLRRTITHALATFLGIMLGFSSLAAVNAQNLPSDAADLARIPPEMTAESFVAKAVARTGAAVVRIDTEAIITRPNSPFFDDPFFQEFFGEQFRVPTQQRVAGQGSGFIIDGSGLILTNAHVVDNADKVTVTLKDGRSFKGEVRGTDEITDLAVVKINPQGEKLPVAVLGNSASIQVGDWAIAVGNPVGLDNTVTLGIISTIGRSAAKAGIPDKRIDFIQTDAAINPGNSGGPLLNAQGEVIGINTAIRADAMGIGFAIPIDRAKQLQATLESGQKVAHPYIGVQMVNLTPDLARANNQNPNSAMIVPKVSGILVVKVLPNTPAEKAGIRRGDVIVKANNQPVSDGAELQEMVEKTGIGQSLPLRIRRGERAIDLTVITAQMSNQ